jgi:hypothetical protein
MGRMSRPDQPVSGSAPETEAPFGGIFELPPPRRLPRVMVRRIWQHYLKQAKRWLPLGILLLIAGVPIVIICFPWHIRDSLAFSVGPTADTSGTITLVENTGISTKTNHVSSFIYRLYYLFEVDGRGLKGSCYFTGGHYARGHPVQVRYLVSRPELNRLPDGDFDPGGNFGIFLLIFPLIGAGFFGSGAWAVTGGMARALKMARDGVVTEGRVIGVKQNPVWNMGQYRYRITVQFNAPDPHRLTYSGHSPDAEQANRWMESRAAVRVLHDRRRPKRALLLDHFLG